MFALQVFLKVKPDRIDEFIAATLENAAHSRQEDGISCFDLIQREDDPTSFCLFEIYQGPEAHAAHKETEHYAHWKKVVPELLSEDRYSYRYRVIGLHR